MRMHVLESKYEGCSPDLDVTVLQLLYAALSLLARYGGVLCESGGYEGGSLVAPPASFWLVGSGVRSGLRVRTAGASCLLFRIQIYL